MIDLRLVLDTLHANRPRYAWSAQRRGCYEIWLGKVVLPGPAALWFRYALENHGDAEPTATCWGTWFEAGRLPLHLHEVRDLPAPETSPERFDVSLAPRCRLAWDASAEALRATGSLGAGVTALTWDLRFAPAGRPFPYLAWERLQRLLAGSGAVSACPDVRMSGTVTVCGRTVAAERAPGMQGHIFGTRKPHAWAWAHGNAFLDAETGAPVDAAFEAIRVRRAAGGRTLTSVYLRLEAQEWRWNRLTDVLRRNQGREQADAFEIARCGEPALGARFELLPGQVACVDYLDTDGTALVNRNGTLARGTVRVTLQGRERRLEADGTATLELVDRGAGSS